MLAATATAKWFSVTNCRGSAGVGDGYCGGGGSGCSGGGGGGNSGGGHVVVAVVVVVVVVEVEF